MRRSSNASTHHYLSLFVIPIFTTTLNLFYFQETNAFKPPRRIQFHALWQLRQRQSGGA
jgi:hypothetical protein